MANLLLIFSFLYLFAYLALSQQKYAIKVRQSNLKRAASSLEERGIVGLERIGELNDYYLITGIRKK